MANESSDGRNGGSGGRPYRKRRRAEAERQTRERIVEAAVKLHGTVGPAATTVSGVAREAGVQRATVYRHFPDEESLFSACSSRYWSMHPRPDPAGWSEIADRGERARAALGELYGWYRETEDMLDRTGRDIEKVPAMAGPAVEFGEYLMRVATSIVGAVESEREEIQRLIIATVGHSISFGTWQSLVRAQGLEDSEAVELMVRLIRSVER